jgi:hypothetical protein
MAEADPSDDRDRGSEMTTFTWTTGASGDWNSGANWNTGTAPNNAAADVVIDAQQGNTAYQVTIKAGQTDTVHSLTLNNQNNIMNVLANPYTAAILEVDGTLAFAPGSDGTIGGPLQTIMISQGGTIVNAGTVNAFVLGEGNVTFTGTNGIYFTNWLQSQGTVTVDTTSIAELSGTVLFDGIFEAKGPATTINLGGAGEGLIVNIATIEGPPAIPDGWTELLWHAPGSQINEWNGTNYVSVEQSLTTILNRATVDVLEGRDYTTANALTIDAGMFNLQAGTVTTGGITIQDNGTVQGSGIIVGAIVNNANLISLNTGLVLTGALSGTGVVTFGDNASTIEVGAVAAGETITMRGGNTLKLDQPANFHGTIVAHPGDRIDLKGITADKATLQGSDLVVTHGGATVATLHLAGSYAGDSFTVASSGGNAELAIVCYARGTQIMTPHGEVPIERLKPGQLVVTASGETQPIVWVGRRKVDCARHPVPHLAQPVRIKAGSFGRAMPHRDLVVSPAHAIYDEGVLIPARFLINGRNVVQEDVATVEYFHIELERHDLILAEGLPAETYLENNDRDRFENGGDAMVLHPDFARWNWDGRACAELAVTGEAFEAVRAKLARNAALLRKASRRRSA